MKKNKLFLMVFAIVGLFYSCDDAIDIKQPGEQNDPDHIYQTVADIQRGLNGVYGTLSTESTIEFTSIFTDEVAIGKNNGGQGLNDGTYSFQLLAGSTAPAAIWQSNYTTINFANRILVAADKIKPTLDPIDDENDILELNFVYGQLYAIRAFCHFQLLTYFSTDLKDDSALGVMLLDFVPDENYDTFLPRSTNGECFAFIDEDLAKADELIDQSADNNLMNPDVIKAIRARMAAYRGQYTVALGYANDLIDDYGPLIKDQEDYAAVWADTSTDELIFYLSRVLGDFEIGSYWNSQESSSNGSPFFEVNRALYNLYQPGDIRGYPLIVDETSSFSDNPATDPEYKENDVLVVNKYPGNEDQGSNLLNNIKVFRVSEMYLIKAEAYAAAGVYEGGANSVSGVLGVIRKARFGGVTQPTLDLNTAEEAWAAILNERRIELAFEGHRYIDIKRLGVLAGGLGIDRYFRDCAINNACTLPPTDHRFTMPIPTSELVANPNIRSQQNPGY
jgi:hypothetical protein